MHLDVQLTNMVESRYTLQPWWHVMQVSSDPVTLQPRRIGLCRIEDLIPGGDVLHPLLHVSGHFADNAVVLVHGIRSAAAQGLGYLLRQFGHLEDGRKARERDQGGGELEVNGFLINLQMTLSYEADLREVFAGLTNLQIV